ncbi:MAG UNVERIFIED_CONTAM: cyclic nucleotide-binding domain-containing protein [Anaerolineae bacterium]
MRRVWTVAHVHVYQAGALIFAEGMRCSGFFVLLEGSVRVFRVGHEGRLHTLNSLRPISTFNRSERGGRAGQSVQRNRPHGFAPC